MTSQRPLVALVIANVLIPVAILVFAIGFFPYKPFLPGRASFEDDDIRNAPFDKIIFMVVDALRSDFVYSYHSGFNFTQRLIRSGAAMPFTAHATSPTITMPRVKAMTTGSIPSFLDVILNFAESDTSSNLAHQDTWLAQLKEKPGGKLTLYGDDTWLKLFPETFSRADGTTSFFVSDFTEVDNNVTRHLSTELDRSDWNGMFMHYLGLDHIGHKLGPKSPHMIPKHFEMDSIVQEIYTALESKSHLSSALLVVCGDHGMNDAGNHGGSTESETSPALVFVSPKLQSISEGFQCPSVPTEGEFNYYKTVEQSDIAPTLAGLLGFPVPLNNLGVFIPELLYFWKQDERVRLVEQNAAQILRIVKETFPSQDFDGSSTRQSSDGTDSDGETLENLWNTAATSSDHRDRTMPAEKLQALVKFSKCAQKILSSAASNYDIRKLSIGKVILAVAMFTVALNVWPTISMSRNPGPGLLYAIIVLVMYGTMMFASSYVEEEHHLWYWASTGWLGLLLLKARSLNQGQGLSSFWSTAALLGCLRVTRSWNQTGQKHAGEPDIARTILPAFNSALWAVVLAAYLFTSHRFFRRISFHLPWATAGVSICLWSLAFGFKARFTKRDAPELFIGLESWLFAPFKDISFAAQATWTLGALGAWAFMAKCPGEWIPPGTKGSTQDILWPLHDLLSLFLMTESRVTNIPIFLLFEVQLQTLRWLDLSSSELTMTSILLQYASFFAFGGSNAISSIDLSNAYNGISGYNVVAVGILTFCSNWAGPIWWTSATVILLSEKGDQRPSIWLRHLSLMTGFVASSVLSVMLACTVLRAHLFIWTVFSPKYLYSMAWSLGQHLCINVLFGSALYKLGEIKLWL